MSARQAYLRRLVRILLLINLFVIALAALSVWNGHRQYQERAEVTTRNLAQVLETTLINAIQRVDVSLLALLDIHAIHHAEHQKNFQLMNRHIASIRARLPEVDAIRLTDRNGLLISGSDFDAAARVSLADRPHFTRLRDDPTSGLLISQPQISRINNKTVIVLARRAHHPDGSFDGMLFAAVSIESLTKQFASLDLGAHGAVTLRDAELRLIARHPHLESVGLSIGDRYASPELQALYDAGTTDGTFYTRTGLDQKPRTVTLRKLGDVPLYITVVLAAEDYLADWRTDTHNLIFIVTLFLFASLYAGRAQYRSWLREQASNEQIIRQEALYHELVEDTPMLVVRYLPDTTITFANAAYATFFDSTPEALLGKQWLDFIAEDTDRSILLAQIASMTPEHPSTASTQHRVLGKDHQTHWMQWTDRAFFDANGVLTHLQSVGEDITERKRVRDVQAARLRLMEFTAEHSMHELLVATLDEAGTLTESPIGFYHFLDADQKTLALQAWSTLTSRHYCKAEGEGRHYNIDEAGVWVEAIRERRAIIHNDYAALTNKRGLPPGHAALIREMVVPVFRKGLIVAILGVGNKATPYTDDDLQAISLLADLAWDFAESKHLEAELVAMATTDFLTGLYNRRNFMSRMEEELARLKRFDIERATVLMFDLDHFKRVNDNHGHAAGDAVLTHFSNLMRDELRKVDTGGRIGGEEFAILLLGSDIAAAELFAERLRQKVASTPLTLNGITISITVSIGITRLDADDMDADAALMRADAALYDAKHGGRNRVCVHTT
jgi:diguanylate cyclase (GGDEF)-like protein/PAS domain S-box-containing protein